MQTEIEFRDATRAKYAVDFELVGRLIAHLEELIQTPRSVTTLYDRAQDMLFLQSFKAIQSAFILSEIALVEDAATIVRRQFEIAMRAMWLQARGESDAIRGARLDDFFAAVWHEWLDLSSSALPANERQVYEAIYTRASSTWKKGKGPPNANFRELFEAAGASELYCEDYKFLSRIAHGTAPMLVHAYASDHVNVHDDRFVPAVLRATLRAGLITAIIWNATFEVTDGVFLDDMARTIANLPE